MLGEIKTLKFSLNGLIDVISTRYVLDVNAYLHKIFSSLFEDRKAP